MLERKSVGEQWAQTFFENHGRRPNVLHIGNIANNAYNNAKLLGEVGFACDVICYDYYHIMGCPEWEDADFENTLSDDFRPDWREVNLRGFVRPSWFAQGPVSLCVDYLLARQDGHAASAAKLWRVLAGFNHSMSLSWRERFRDFPAAFHYGVEVHLRRKLRAIMRLDATQLGLVLAGRVRLLRPSEAALLAHCFTVIRDGLKSLAALPGVLVRHWYQLLRGGRSSTPPKESSLQDRLLEKWAAGFPDRCLPPTRADLAEHPANGEQWIRLLKSYDIVIGYSTDPIYPMLAAVPYFAFEHGTLRHIPYQNDLQGRITAASYHEAAHVFVTNFDCVASAERLVGQRYTFINHPFDDQHGQYVKGGLEQRLRLQRKLDADFLFFFPTRQDWVEGTGYADKSNDVFFRAMARLRSAGLRVGAICCDWGKNVEQSKVLLASLGLDANVEWTPPLPVIPFERLSMAADIVVDQFKLGAFGGVVFKAMAVGAPILTYLNEPLLKAQYPVLPPVINCRTEDDIVTQVSALLADPAALAQIGQRSRQWISAYHAKQETVNLQVAQFSSLLGAPLLHRHSEKTT
ncbi:glycosyltransferase [Polaromonas sp.]|uniref:glycosyltransferase n=1 Tax=Polaromonas sp. TaxID=1869339 RepID=UPI003BA8F550